MSLHAVDPPGDASWPRAGEREVVFLVDATGTLEERLVGDWIERRRPDGARYRVASLPASRRRRPQRRWRFALQRVLDDSEGDTLLVPLRVAWSSPVRRSRRVPRLIDLITLGDPRDPNRLLQELIVRLRPERVSVIAGESASVDDLRRFWSEDRAVRSDGESAFAEFVALRGALSLEVAERRMRGNRYKVPRFLAEDLVSSASFQAGVDRLAARLGEDDADLRSRTARYLREIAATPSTFVIDLAAALVRSIYTMGYDRRIRYDKDALERIAALGQQHSLAFLPSHKSNMDHLALTHVLYENGLPPNHTAGGINMNFFPIGPLLRRHGIFFIRRSFKDNEPYKFVLKHYIDYLLARRFPLEWYPEGGRSRTGKLRAPRYGMLSYVADSWRRGSCEDVVLVPISIAYDQIQDVGAHAAEQKGGAKERESLAWMVRVLRSLRRRYGRIHVSFGDPIMLSEALDRYPAGEEPDVEASNLEIAKLAFEVSVRINRVTPITPISLVTLTLLQSGHRAMTVAEVLAALGDFIRYVEARNLPVTEHLALDDEHQVRAALDALVDHGVVTRWEGGTETVYAVGPEQHLAAAFYRNTIVHFFTTAAIAEVALAGVEGTPDPEAAFWDEVAALRDLLKFEFFFAEKDAFRDEVAAEVGFHAPGWTDLIGTDPMAVVEQIRPRCAPWVLRPILEAYLVVADALVAHDFRAPVEQKHLIERSLALGEQYRAQQRIHSPEAVSTVLFESGVRLAANRGLLEAGEVEVLRCRQDFAAGLRALVERVGE